MRGSAMLPSHRTASAVRIVVRAKVVRCDPGGGLGSQGVTTSSEKVRGKWCIIGDKWGELLLVAWWLGYLSVYLLSKFPRKPISL